VRTKTRKERYEEKGKNAKIFPFEVCTVNFAVDDNVGFIVRAAACFGASQVNVIGSMPSHSVLAGRSGTTQELVHIKQFANVHQFLEYIRLNEIHLISAELDNEAISIHEYLFPINKQICVVIGHETSGIPTEILMNSDKVFIPMPGRGFCLNTSQTGNIFLYEMSKRYITN